MISLEDMHMIVPKQQRPLGMCTQVVKCDILLRRVIFHYSLEIAPLILCAIKHRSVICYGAQRMSTCPLMPSMRSAVDQEYLKGSEEVNHTSHYGLQK